MRPAHAATDRGIEALGCVNKLLVIPLILAGACVLQEPGPSVDQTTADIEQYEEVQAELDLSRSEFRSDEADQLRAVGTRSFWLQFPQFAPDLYSWSPGDTSPTRFDFEIGGDAYNYVASDQLIVTAIPQGGEVAYRAYGLTQPEDFRGELVLDAPSDEQRWWAYAADGNKVFIAVNESVDRTSILSWAPGGEATELFALEDLGMQVGELWDLFAYRGRLIVIESGRLWVIDPGTRTATFMQNEQEVQSLSINKNGVVYPAQDGPRYVAFAGGPPIDVGELIENAEYQLNETFASAHHYASHPVLFEDQVVYIGQSGVFSVSLQNGQVRPLLLEPRDTDIRLVYRDPQVLDDGTLFLQGLASPSGSIGADGPIYTLNIGE